MPSDQVSVDQHILSDIILSDILFHLVTRYDIQ